MEVLKGIQQLTRTFPRTVVTVGNFDGVHLGHREILNLTLHQARERDGRSVVYTFRPHPRIALQQDACFRLLSTYEERLELFARFGLDLVIEEPFSREFSTTSAEAFFAEFLVKRLGAEAIVVGHDFGFGKSREAHLDTLTRFCRQTGVALTVVPPFKVGEEVVSSSKIRQYLAAGRLEDASRLLGYRFSVRGIVVRGHGRGKTLGFATANLQIEEKLLPSLGVYAAWAFVEGVAKPAVVNIGFGPTFREKSANSLAESAPAAVVEAHLLEFSGDLYGKRIELKFAQKLRDERRFSSADELKSQIRQDADASRSVLDRSSP